MMMMMNSISESRLCIFSQYIQYGRLFPINSDVSRLYSACTNFNILASVNYIAIYTDADRIAIVRISDSVNLSVRTIKPKRLKPKSPNLAQGSPRYLAHQWILDQKVKGQGHRVTKCITLRQDSRAAPSLCGCVVAQRDGPAWPSRHATTQPRRRSTVLFNAIDWSV